MSLFPYALLRPALFGIDPESAHDITLKAVEWLQHTALEKAFSQDMVDDPVVLAGLRFPNRVGLAAGLDKNARCIDGFGALGFGFVEVGTVTPEPQAGNPKPRMFRLPQARALINRMGFNSVGLTAFVQNLRRSGFRSRARILGINIGKNASTTMERAAEDYETGLAAVYALADYISINISSPNSVDLRALQSDQALDTLLAALAAQRESLIQQHGRRVPLFVKIAPDLDPAQIDWIAACLRRHDMDGVIATNTTTSRLAVAGLRHGEEAGGLSGAPLLLASNQVVRRLRAALGPDFPIIGVGGIMSAEDAQSKIEAGADVVQIYTGLIYCGPSLVVAIAKRLKKLRVSSPRAAV